jgi:hypothetical protein
MSEEHLTPIEVAELLAKKVPSLDIEQIKAVLTAQAELAYASADQGFPIPGVGLLVRVGKPARKVTLSFGPRKGEVLDVPASRTIRFTVSRLAKEMLLGERQSMPDIFKPVHIPEFAISFQSIQLPDSSPLVADLGQPFALASDESAASVFYFSMGDLTLSTGRIVASDGLVLYGAQPFTRSVSPGRYPLVLAVVQVNDDDERVGLAIIRFSSNRIARWEMATRKGQDPATLKADEFFGYPVDSGTGSFVDASVLPLIEEALDAGVDFGGRLIHEMHPPEKARRHWLHVQSSNGSLAIFSSGYGDGRYASYFGLDEAGNPAALVTDFGIVKWGPVSADDSPSKIGI